MNEPLTCTSFPVCYKWMGLCLFVLFSESMHNMPVGQMGNYQEYLKRMPTPLRELESAPVRQHMFGNPFKIDKKMIIDEADIDLPSQGGKSPKKEPLNNNVPPVVMSPVVTPMIPTIGMSPMPRGLKRKAGPLPKDYRYTPYKSRRTHRGMEEESDSEGYLSSAPSSPMTPMIISPPSSPSPYDFSREKENLLNDKNSTALSLSSLSEIISSNDTRMFGDEGLMIDESPPAPAPPPIVENNKVPSSLSFGSSIFSSNEMCGMNVNAPADDLQQRNEEKYEPEEPYHQIHRYEMNGSKNIVLQGDDVKKVTSSKGSPVVSNSLVPPDNGKIVLPAAVVSNHVNATNHIISSSSVHLSTNSNHAGTVSPSNTKGKKRLGGVAKSKSSSPVKTSVKQETQAPQAPVDEADNEKTENKNLSIRIDLFNELRRPRLRKLLTYKIQIENVDDGMTKNCTSTNGFPGTDYILSQLTMLAGSFNTKHRFIKSLEREALRFKRKNLAAALQEQAEVLAPLCRKTTSS
jgi:hypothetical protein